MPIFQGLVGTLFPHGQCVDTVSFIVIYNDVLYHPNPLKSMNSGKSNHFLSFVVIHNKPRFIYTAWTQRGHCPRLIIFTNTEKKPVRKSPTGFCYTFLHNLIQLQK